MSTQEQSIKRINVTASTSYDGDQVTVKVNSVKPLKLSTPDFDIYVIVRIRDFAENDSPDTDSQEEEDTYFETENHKRDSFSIQFTLKFKKDVTGDQLKWGNDWDEPIRDILPWGFSAAFATFKYAIDPGVDGDPYADKPWIYGALLSSINTMQKVEGDDPSEIKGPIVEPDAKSRRKEYLEKEKLGTFTFKSGDVYAFDFSTPYLDMSTTPKIKLPGFTFDVGKYAGLTKLRYSLKCDDDLVFAITFEAEK